MVPMRIVVTGTQGQIARELALGAGPDFEIVLVGRPTLDLCAPVTVQLALSAASPDIVISCAAYTAVDKAEI